MKLPIGYSDFKEIIENNLDLVDKSLFIKDIIDEYAQVTLITRPRRFGKTLNMSMLHYYFAAEVEGIATAELFNHLKIANAGENYLQHQGKYPVIFLTFKDIKERQYADAYKGFCRIISKLYNEHIYLLDSAKLHAHEKENYDAILKQQASRANIQASLKDLTEYLYRHHGTKPLVLIDEYDTPIQSSYLNGYYDDIIELFRHFFGAALKDNSYLFKAVLTGILRISKESLFSGLNNLKVYSILHPKYGEYFGFTEAEVAQLLQQAQFQEYAPQVKSWYNGYQIGNHTLYNPWSIVNCIEDRAFKPYWINTSDNALIKNLLLKSSDIFKEQFEALLTGQSIEQIINENFVFSDIHRNQSSVWNLLFLTGYLKIITYQDTDQGAACQLDIPNHEIRSLYRTIIEEGLSDGFGLQWYNQFLAHLLKGEISEFSNNLRQIMEQTISMHDLAAQPEAFYHGFILGLTASLYGDSNYETHSNRESGYGRYDYMIFSHDPNKFTLLLEFKKITLPRSRNTEASITKLLQQGATAALQQINQHAYLAEATQRNRKKILKLGLAFSGKRFEIAYEI